MVWHDKAILEMGRRMHVGLICDSIASVSNRLASSTDEQLTTFFFLLYLHWKQLKWFHNHFQKAYNIGKMEVFLVSVSTENSFIAVRVKLIIINFSFNGIKNDG